MTAWGMVGRVLLGAFLAALLASSAADAQIRRLPNWQLPEGPAWIGPMPAAPLDVFGVLIWRDRGALVEEPVELIRFVDPVASRFSVRLDVLELVVAFWEAPNQVKLSLVETGSRLSTETRRAFLQPTLWAHMQFPASISWVYSPWRSSSSWCLRVDPVPDPVPLPSALDEIEIEYVLLICRVNVLDP